MGLLGALSLHTYHNICVGPQTNAFPHATSPARFIGVRKTPSPDSLDPSPARQLCCPRVHHSIWLAMYHAHASILEQRHKKRNCHASTPTGRGALRQHPRPIKPGFTATTSWLPRMADVMAMDTYLVLLNLQWLPTNSAGLQCCTLLNSWDYRPEWSTCRLTHRQHLKVAGIGTTASAPSLQHSDRRICTHSF